MEKVVITGANRGLGYELLKKYDASHFITFPIVRTEESYEQLLNEFPTNCYPILADLTSDDAKTKIISILSDTVDNVDILINNAGVSGTGSFIETISTDEVNLLYNIHCIGPIRVVQACLPFMRKSVNPKIINVSSRLGSMTKNASGEFINNHFSYSYRMAKAAQNMFSICLSQELQSQHITVCAIHPGQLLTRGRSPDANTDPAMSAALIFEWINTLDISQTGSFVHPGTGELPW
ncbi:C-factor [compost metagenome]